MLGDIVDTLLRQSPCPVIVVKPGRRQDFNRWLLPSAGGPNSKLALKILPALTALGNDPQIHLCAIATKRDDQHCMHRQLVRRAGILERRLRLKVKTRMTVNDNVAEAIVKLGDRYQSDVIVLGASREGLFSHVLKGNIPLEVAYHSDSTVLLVQNNFVNARSVRIPNSEDNTDTSTEPTTSELRE
jgi:CIC family chloride channel protein